jgi:hypothetical protein
LQPQPAAFNEAAWQAWLAKGRLRDEQSARTRLQAVKIVSILGLLAAAAFWPYVASYEVVLRFAVMIAAAFLMLHAVRSRHYVVATLFGATALFYNPVVQLFAVSDDLKRVLLAVSATPFILSLGWRDMRRKP